MELDQVHLKPRPKITLSLSCVIALPSVSVSKLELLLKSSNKPTKFNLDRLLDWFHGFTDLLNNLSDDELANEMLIAKAFNKFDSSFSLSLCHTK